MNRTAVQSWSLTRSLALMAALFAMVLGALLPFAAQASAQPGQSILICTTAGPKRVQAGATDMDGPASELHLYDCAACVIPMPAILPEATRVETLKPTRTATVVMSPAVERRLPPARAPPKPPSTAPPHA